jgi:hypothetical protein
MMEDERIYLVVVVAAGVMPVVAIAFVLFMT